jgi:hypothetical protein
VFVFLAKICQCATWKVALQHLKGSIKKNPKNWGSIKKKPPNIEKYTTLVSVQK